MYNEEHVTMLLLGVTFLSISMGTAWQQCMNKMNNNHMPVEQTGVHASGLNLRKTVNMYISS